MQDFFRDMPDIVFDHWPLVVFVPVVLVVLAALVGFTRWYDSRDRRHGDRAQCSGQGEGQLVEAGSAVERAVEVEDVTDGELQRVGAISAEHGSAGLGQGTAPDRHSGGDRLRQAVDDH